MDRSGKKLYTRSAGRAEAVSVDTRANLNVRERQVLTRLLAKACSWSDEPDTWLSTQPS